MNGAHEGATQDARPSAKRKWMEDRCAMMDANVLLLAVWGWVWGSSMATFGALSVTVQ